jgi:hypothetical protein
MPDKNILAMLSAGFLETPHKELGKVISGVRHAPLTEVLAVLTRVERTPGLTVDLFGLVAAAKVALSHPGDEAKVDAFVRRAWRIQGLL